jgi:hypothetical protein
MIVQPTVSTRKKVPINSATYFFILAFWIDVWKLRSTVTG